MNRKDKDVSDVTACVVDHGLFLPLALKLGEQFKRVLYYSPWEKGFPVLNDVIIGDGYESQMVERVDDIWEHLKEIDLFIFLDIQHSGLQQHLESIGKAVWGSREGDDMELKRTYFKELQSSLGMKVPFYDTIRGISNLRSYLKEHDDRYVKISRFRGCMETWHHITYDLSRQKLDQLAVKFGPLQDSVPFVVEAPIKTDIEVGYDGFTIDGQFPAFGVQGFEVKDRALIGAVQKYSEMPDEVTSVNEAIAPALKNYRVRNFFSTEIRVADGESYLIDPTLRCPSPCIEIQMELWSNLAEFIWAGANGELVDPEPVAMFGVEAVIDHHGDESEWRTLEIPRAAEQWTKIYNCCKHDGLTCIPPLPHSHDSIGFVVGIGDTLEDAISHLKENAEKLKEQPMTIHLEGLYNALSEIHEAEKKGIKFSKDELPEPEETLQ